MSEDDTDDPITEKRLHSMLREHIKLKQYRDAYPTIANVGTIETKCRRSGSQSLYVLTCAHIDLTIQQNLVICITHQSTNA